MKRAFYTLLMASALTFPALHAHAQGLGIGVGTNTGVSVGNTADSNSQTKANTNVGTNINTHIGRNAAGGNIGINADTNTKIRANAQNAIKKNSVDGTSATMAYFAHDDLNSQTVTALQESLNAHGYRVNSINGKLDNSTLTQLQRFESDQGLSASAESRLNTRTMQQLGVGLQDMNPAAGGTISSRTDTRVRAQGNAGAGFNE